MKVDRRFPGHKSCYDCRWRGYQSEDERRPTDELRKFPVLSPHVCLARLERIPIRENSRLIGYDFVPMRLCASAESFLADPGIRVSKGKIYVPYGATSRDLHITPDGRVDDDCDTDRPVKLVPYHVVTVQKFLDDELRSGWCPAWLPGAAFAAHASFRRLLRKDEPVAHDRTNR